MCHDGGDAGFTFSIPRRDAMGAGLGPDSTFDNSACTCGAKLGDS